MTMIDNNDDDGDDNERYFVLDKRVDGVAVASRVGNCSNHIAIITPNDLRHSVHKTPVRGSRYAVLREDIVAVLTPLWKATRLLVRSTVVVVLHLSVCLPL